MLVGCPYIHYNSPCYSEIEVLGFAVVLEIAEVPSISYHWVSLLCIGLLGSVYSESSADAMLAFLWNHDIEQRTGAPQPFHCIMTEKRNI